MAFSPDGKRLAAAGEDHTVKVWDATTSQEARSFRVDNDRVKSIAFSADGRWCASAGKGKVRLWDLASGREFPIPCEDRRRLFSPTFRQDGKCLAAVTDEGTVRVWEVPAGLLDVAGEPP